MRYTAFASSTVLVVALGLAGCFSPNLGAAPFNCGVGGTCPGGYTCVDSVCRLDSTVVGGDAGGVLPDITQVGDSSMPTHGTQSCSQVLACAGGCSGAGCIDGCRQMGTESGTADFDALSACLSGDCGTECGGADRSACGQCANTKCKDELEACQKDQTGNPSDGGPPADTSMWHRPDGFNPNPDGGPGEPDGSQTFDTLQPPEDTVVGQDTFTPPPDVPMGNNLSCGQLLDCINGCQDQTCADSCYARATPEAQMTYDTASQCVNDNCSFECLVFGGDVCNLCVAQYCSAETGACM